jgi:hypothetical protein
MFGVMLILPMPCLFVLLRLAARLRESWRQSWYLEISSLRQVVPLITFYLPNNVPVNHCDMLRLIWLDLICFPRLVYPTPCLPLNFWVVLLLLNLVLGLILHYDHVPVILLFNYCSWQDHLDVLFGFKQNVGPKRLLFSRLIPMQRSSTTPPIKRLKRWHLQTSLVIVVIGEFCIR